MLHDQFEHQHVADSIENEMVKLKNAANILETVASSSKMLQIPPTCCKIHGKWKGPTPKCCNSWNGSFQHQNAANSKENAQNSRSQKIPKWKSDNPKAIPDRYAQILSCPILFGGATQQPSNCKDVCALQQSNIDMQWYGKFVICTWFRVGSPWVSIAIQTSAGGHKKYPWYNHIEMGNQAIKPHDNQITNYACEVFSKPFGITCAIHVNHEQTVHTTIPKWWDRARDTQNVLCHLAPFLHGTNFVCDCFLLMPICKRYMH